MRVFENYLQECESIDQVALLALPHDIADFHLFPVMLMLTNELIN
jgi:hypothetical protein